MMMAPFAGALPTLPRRVETVETAREGGAKVQSDKPAKIERPVFSVEMMSPSR